MISVQKQVLKSGATFYGVIWWAKLRGNETDWMPRGSQLLQRSTFPMEAELSDNAGATHPGVLLGIAALCIALNVGLGTIVNITKLPVYLDAVGTIAIALLSGPLGGRGFALAAMVGAMSFLLTGILFNPVVIWFIPTQVAIAAFAFFVVRPTLRQYLNDEKLTFVRALTIAVLGVMLGIVAGIVSAPIIVYVFGGITGSGTSLIVAVLLKAGRTLYESVLATGLASESLDKTLQLILAIALVMATPRRIRSSGFAS